MPRSRYIANFLICQMCQSKFEPNSNNQKLCPKCRLKICEYCGGTFDVSYWGKKRWSEAKFCSSKCYFNSRWKTTDFCKNCGKKIIRGRYCSQLCSKTYWNKYGYHLHGKKRFWDKKIKLIQELGGKCVNCGYSDIRALDINHIDRQRKKIPKKRQYTTLRRLKDWRENKGNLELMCANCHRIHTWVQMGYGKVQNKILKPNGEF